jgi:hypothetical protein
MIITIGDINYNTDYTFEQQTTVTKLWINEQMSNITPTFIFDESNRPNLYIYTLNNLYHIEKELVWNTPAPSCGVEKEIITIKNN